MNKTKKSLLMGAMSLLLCISMLIGSTFAWFTDSVASAGNKIQSGTLKVDLELLDKETGVWNSLKESQAPIFNYDKWEPGYIDTKVLKVENEGNLALKWVAKFYSEYQLSILADVIDVYVRSSASEIGYPTDRNLEGYTCVGNLRTFINSIEETTYGTLEAKEVSYLGLALKMREEAGNEYQGLSLGGAFDIRIFATQYTSESDSYNNQYDKNATFEDLANTSILATATKTLAAGANSVDFDLSYNGLKIAKVIVPASAIADTSKPVTVTFDGIKPSRVAIVDDSTEAYAYDITVTNLKDNLAGDQLVTVVVTAPNALAAMKAYHNGTLIKDAVYDEVEGTITFKTANFSPYDFTSQVEEVSNLAGLRSALQKDGTTAKLMEDMLIDLAEGKGARSDEHKVLSSNGKSMWYNGVNIKGKSVGLDLNGHKITVKCYDADNYDGYSNEDVGALFFVDKEGSLNITDRVGGGFIKMESSIYAVWAPYDDPSYMDIYSGVFIADSYAGDPIGTPPEADDNPRDDKMKYENSNRALIYAGNGGNMNIYGGYYLYNNTPNDFLNRNNGAFNCTNWYEGPNPYITIHDGVMLIDKAYRQDPTYTSTPHGSFDDYSIKLAKGCDIAKTTLASPVTIDGKTYDTWYKVIMGINSITAKAKKSVYTTGYGFTTADFDVFAFSKDGSSGTVTNFTVGAVDTTTPGKKNVTIAYTNDGESFTTTCVVEVMNLETTSNTVIAPKFEQYQGQWYQTSFPFGTGNFDVSGWANILGGGDYASYVGQTYTAPNGEIVTGFNVDYTYTENGGNRTYTYGEHYYDLTITNAKPYTTLGINCLVGYTDTNNPIKGFGCYINNDKSTLQWNAPAIVHEAGSWEAEQCGTNNGHSLTSITCEKLQPGKTYVIHWVVVFEDGLSELCEWTVTMAEATSNDAVFTETEKPNANVIVMSGQSNMFGAAPLTQDIIEKYSSVDYSNVFIKYANINFDVATDGSILGSLSTVFSNEDFEEYEVGIGAQGNTYFGPELALAYQLATNPAYSDQQWFIVKYAAAGTALSSQWTANCTVDGKTTTLTKDMLAYIQDALDDIEERGFDARIRSFMWMQGESDASSSNAANNYATLEEQLVKNVRETFASYATRATNALTTAGSGISFLNAGIADNATKQPATGDNGLNDWIYSREVNAGKISNSQWICSVLGATTNEALTVGPLTGYVFGVNIPSIANPDQSGVIVNSIYIDTCHLSSKAQAYTNGLENYGNDGDNTDWAHYSASSMAALGELYGSCLQFMILQNN